jgi:amino acid adenylation domain-containing protein
MNAISNSRLLSNAVAMSDEIGEAEPDRIAITCGAKTLNYGELRQQSDSIAHELQKQGATQGTIVGYWGERDINWPAAVIGILKSGAVYLPLDPQMPASRISSIIEQSRCSLAVGPSRLRDSNPFQGKNDGIFTSIETALAGADAPPGAQRSMDGGPAYILFTSGSTGRPKGAIIGRSGLNNHLMAKIEWLGLTRHDCVAQTASHCFDISLWQLLAGLCVGSRVTIVDDSTIRSPIELLKALRERAVTVVQFVPSLLAVFIDYLQTLASDERRLDALRVIATVGEPLTPGLVRAWFALFPGIPILNHYGPTECADGVTHHLVSGPPDKTETYIPIGKPIRNVEVYVADGTRLCEAGEIGEICVSGVGVGSGYINDERRTKDAFGPNPFSNHPSYRRLYRTGDLGRVRPDGLLECLGRRDRQIKMRGHRIELAEIESHLCAHPLVSGAVAVAPLHLRLKLTARNIASDRGNYGSRYLAAYVATSGEVAEDELRNFLAGALPGYMVPERILRLAKIPLTRNGKVDFAALPDPETVRPIQTPFAEPKTELESRIREIWCEALRFKDIGVDDAFLSLGGDSLRAMAVLGQMQTQLGVKADFRLVLNGTVRSLAAWVASQSDKTNYGPAPERGFVRQQSPLTRVQEQLWFLWQLDPAAKNYVMQGGLRIRGAIDLAALQQAWADVFMAHQALSARFADADGPVQVFDAPYSPDLGVIDVTDFSPLQADQLLSTLRQAELGGPFDLSKGRLFRARLIRYGAEDHLILITAHEIIIDAWSLSVLVRDLWTRYCTPAAFRPEKRVSLSSYALWESTHMTPKSLSEQRVYWRRQIGDDPPVLSLGTNRLRSKTISYRGFSHPIMLDTALSGLVRAFARKHKCTTSTTLLACFKLLLLMYSGQENVIVGMPHVVRGQPGSEDIVGFFLNMLPIRKTIDLDNSFAVHAMALQACVSDAITMSAYPFGWMVKDTRFCREPGRSPIFQVMFNMYSESAEPLPKSDLEMSFREYDTGYVKFDLTLYAQDEGEEIALQLAYAEEILSHDQVVRMGDTLRHIIATCIGNPSIPLRALTLVSPADVAMLEVLNDTEQTYESELSLVEAFDRICTVDGERVAYFGEFGDVTFDSLRQRMDSIGSALRAHGVSRGDVVAVLVDRSPDVAAVTLALRALRAIALPISPDFPAARIEHEIEDSGASLLVRSGTEIGIKASVRVLSLARLPPGQDTAPRDFLMSGTSIGRDGASLIYTSASTGKAKGVLIPECAILNRLHWMWRCFPFDRTDVMVVQKSAPLVAAAWEYFGGLLRGIPTLIVSREQLLDPELFLDALSRHRVTRLFASPPVLLGMIAAQQRSPRAMALRLVTSSAEPMPPSLPLRWRECFPDAQLWNFYGATECASNAAVYQTGDEDDGSTSVPVGRPIDNVKIYVLDARLNRVPVGALGELCVAGRCVTAGYWRDQDRTRQKFVPNPYGGGQYSLLYRTGDIARISSSGLLEICGRSDNQVKLRGFRIELEEIEAAIESHPGVARAAALLDGTGEDRRLAAIVIPRGDGVGSAALFAHLRQRLPPYMVPSTLRLVDALPLTASGKIDRPGLAAVPFRDAEDAACLAPNTERERALLAIWQSLLGVNSVGVDESFFDIGGDSLLCVRCVTLARNAGLNLSVEQLYRTPTIRALAMEDSPATVSSADATGSLPPTPAVSSWNSLVGFDVHYNIGDIFFLPAGALNVSTLRSALAQIIDQHDGLRLRIARGEQGLIQTFSRELPDSVIEEVDLAKLSKAEQRETIERIAAERQHVFRFDGKTALIKLTVFRTSADGDCYLLILLHHFVVDGFGYRLFLEALDAACTALLRREPVETLAGGTTLYRWLTRLEHYANDEAPRELDYWEALPFHEFDLALPEAGRRVATFSNETARKLYYAIREARIDEEYCLPLWKDQAKYHFALGRIETSRLLGVTPRSTQCEEFDIFLAALTSAFGRAFGNYSIWADSLTSTRGRLFDDVDPSQIIGYVGELVPLPLCVNAVEPRLDRARSIYRQRNALPRKGIGFRAMKFLSRNPAVRDRIDRLPLPRIGVNYRAGLQRQYPRSLFGKAPEPIWIGEDMDESAMNYLFWFRVGYQADELRVEVRYEPSQVTFETTHRLCGLLREELEQTIAEANPQIVPRPVEAVS